MYDELKCSVCGGPIIYHDSYDWIYEGDTHTECCEGYCETCGQEHTWENIYTFSHSQKLKKEEFKKEIKKVLDK